LAERRGHFAHPVERPAVNDFDSDGAESLGDLRGLHAAGGIQVDVTSARKNLRKMVA
jgi:hypothetical protein